MSHEKSETYTKLIYITEDIILEHIKGIETADGPAPNLFSLREVFLKGGRKKHLSENVFNSAIQRAIREERIRFVIFDAALAESIRKDDTELDLLIKEIETTEGRLLSSGDIEYRLKNKGIAFPGDVLYKLINSGALGFVVSRGKRDFRSF